MEFLLRAAKKLKNMDGCLFSWWHSGVDGDLGMYHCIAFANVLKCEYQLYQWVRATSTEAKDNVINVIYLFLIHNHQHYKRIIFSHCLMFRKDAIQMMQECKITAQRKKIL